MERAADGSYENEDIALNTGMILHELLQHELLAKVLLYSDAFDQFPYYIETTSFGVSCDAFANMKEALVRHRAMAADYLQTNYDQVRSGLCAPLTAVL